MQNKLNNVPYNTGKVKIGCHYVPPKTNYMDDDGIYWQGVLLGIHQRRQTNKMQFTLYLVALVIIFIVLGVWA